MSRGRALVVLALALVGIILGRQAWEAWQLRQPGFHERDCWFDNGLDRGARCGFLVVRENRQKTDSRTIRLPVVIFEAASEPPRREPILYLTGGPGGQAYLGPGEINEVWAQDLGIFPESHDLIVIGQRGTGLGKPDFDCDEFAAPELAWGAVRPGEGPPDFAVLLTEAARVCAARLQAEGIDLTAYNSRESAADIAELRRALGIAEWTLFGVSYGTRLALSALRYHPEGIRAVVLDSVFPPEAGDLPGIAASYRGALARVFADCSRRRTCVDAYGDLDAAYRRAVAWLSAAPQAVALDEMLSPGDRRLLRDLTGLPEREDLVIFFDHRLLDALLLEALFTKKTRADIPEMIGTTAAGQLKAMTDHARELMIRSAWYDLSAAVLLSHSCRDEAPFDPATEVAAAVAAAGRQGHLINESMTYLLCGEWPSGQAAPVEGTAVHSPVPALLLAGSYDPVTPPSLARAAAENLPNGHVFELAEAGHGAIYESDCARRLMILFLGNLERPPETACSAWEVVPLPPGSKSAENSR